jgi:sulfate permease, SulP family
VNQSRADSRSASAQRPRGRSRSTAGWWPRTTDLPRDLAAGATVALVSVAEGMAYAIVAGVDPVYGLYAGSVTVIVGALISSSTLLVITATNALALVTADKIGALGADVDHATAMFTLSLLIGVVMAVLGLARLGSMVRFISAEVQAGLVAAVALLILLGQYDDLVGYSSKSHGGKMEKAIDITTHLSDWDLPTLGVGVGCITVLIIAKATPLRSYADIFALVIGTSVVSALHLHSVTTVHDIAHIATGWAAVPTPHLPDFSLAPQLIPAAVAAAVVGLSEAATVGAAYPNPDGERSDMSRDFLAHGAANIAGGFFRALPSGGSLSRTGVSVSAGARSRWASVAGGLMLVVLVAVAGSLAERIPLTTLAAILIVIGFDALAKEIRHLIAARWISRPHLVAAIITVLVGVFDELTPAIFTGVGLSLLLMVFAIGDRSHLVAWVVETPDGGRAPTEEAFSAGTLWREATAPEVLPSGEVTVLSVTGAAYFASVYRASDSFPAQHETHGSAVVLQLRDRVFYSLTGVDWLRDLIAALQANDNRVYLADLDPTQRDAVEHSGLAQLLGPDGIVWRDDRIGAAAAEAASRGQRWLTDRAAKAKEG